MMTLENEMILRHVGRDLRRNGGISMATEVRERLEKRLEKIGMRMASLEDAAQADWWVCLYVSWLAMYEEVVEGCFAP